MFKKFKVGDVLSVETTKYVPAKRNLIDGDIPYITRTVRNNGYTGTCGNIDKLNNGNCITIGDISGIAFYQPDNFVAGDEVHKLSREGLGEKEYLFLASALNIWAGMYSYSRRCTPKRIEAETILLPVIKSSDPNHEYTADNINWEYMRDRITELERDHITELDAYLRVVGETK